MWQDKEDKEDKEDKGEKSIATFKMKQSTRLTQLKMCIRKWGVGEFNDGVMG
ncbi:hypothetical protein CYANOKiyG1_09150 [Okeania sp. KiyG1]|nr:hypothetical protein CYANOKiyG1_09150 [Okeania sp. KiyG1]